MKKIKSEKGVITMITLITVLFMVSFLISAYVVVANKVKTQKEILSETKAIYEPKFTMEEIYNSYFSNDNVIPIYNAEQLIKIDTTFTNVNGKYYANDENTTYVLMNDIIFNAIDLGLTTNWTPIDKNTNFPGIFDWNDNTITVTNLKGNIEFYDGKTRITEIIYENLEEDATADIKAAVDSGKIEKVLKETITLNEESIEAIAVVPTGYNVSRKKEEYTLSGGLVITDGENEFVWVPVNTEFEESYSATSSNVQYLEPVTSDSGYSYESQDNLNQYYGQNEDGTNYYDFETDFNYSSHYSEMVTSVNTYNGFYIGRYETTIDENGNIGSKKNTTVLVTNATLDNGKEYLWWGLYDAQRNSNVKGNEDYIQTNMIWGQQWMALQEYLKVNNDVTKGPEGDQSGVLKSGEAIYDENIKDKLNNIYDLTRNAFDYTAETSLDNGYKVYRGGRYNVNAGVMGRYRQNPNISGKSYGSRLTLYIK